MGGLDLKSFSKCYVSTALRLAKSQPTAEDFYEVLYSEVSTELGITETDVKELHHPFHWVFFNNKNGSPFEYVQSGRPGEKPYVRLKEEVREETAEELAGLVLRGHEVHLKARADKIFQLE
ncbi:MAG: hypothetical protein ABIE22_04410 [archaeon]